MKGLNSILIFLWGIFNIGGCAYLVFWRGNSGWWFLLAILLASSITVKKD